MVEFNGFNGRYNELVNGCSWGLQTNIHISLGGSHPFSIVHPQNHPTYQLRRNRIAMMFTTAITGRDDPVPGRIEMAMKRTCRMAIDGYSSKIWESIYGSEHGATLVPKERPYSWNGHWTFMKIEWCLMLVNYPFFHRFPFFPQQKRYNMLGTNKEASDRATTHQVTQNGAVVLGLFNPTWLICLMQTFNHLGFADHFRLPSDFKRQSTSTRKQRESLLDGAPQL